MVEGLTVEDPSIKKDMPADNSGDMELKPGIAEYIDESEHKGPNLAESHEEQAARPESKKESAYQLKPEHADYYVHSSFLMKVDCLAYKTPDGGTGHSSILVTRSEYESMRNQPQWFFEKEELIEAPDIIRNNWSTVNNEERFSYWTPAAKQEFPQKFLNQLEHAQRFMGRN